MEKAYEIKTLNKPEYSSYGIQITAERVHLHNQNEKAGDVKIIDLTEDGVPSGTQVEVHLKNRPITFMLTAIFINDEENNLSALREKILRHCPQVY